MLNTFDGTLTTLEDLKNDTSLEKGRKGVMLKLIKLSIETISISIKSREQTSDFANRGVKIDNTFLDDMIESDLLEDFFGNLPLPEMKEKLKVIKQKIKEVREVIS